MEGKTQDKLTKICIVVQSDYINDPQGQKTGNRSGG